VSTSMMCTRTLSTYNGVLLVVDAALHCTSWLGTCKIYSGSGARGCQVVVGRYCRFLYNHWKVLLLCLVYVQSNFQLISLRGLSGINMTKHFFNCDSKLRVYYTWSAFLSSLNEYYLDLFQTTEGLYYDNYSIIRSIFKSFHGAIYPVSVTTIPTCNFWKSHITLLFFIHF